MADNNNQAIPEIVVRNVVTEVGQHPNSINWDYEVKGMTADSLSFELSWGAPSRGQSVDVGRKEPGTYSESIKLTVERPHHEAFVTFNTSVKSWSYYKVPQVGE